MVSEIAVLFAGLMGMAGTDGSRSHGALSYLYPDLRILLRWWKSWSVPAY